MTDKDIRWKQRYQNFDKALSRLNLALESLKEEPANTLYQMATIQAFEFTYELGWKTIKDYLFFQGLRDAALPRDVIKQGFQNHIISDGQNWINMLEDRNLMAHTYDEKKAEQALRKISDTYLAVLEQVHGFFKEKL